MDKAKITAARRLTPKQQRFVEEYLIDLNATQAAIRAGYSERTARWIGSENLSKPVLSEAINAALRHRTRRTEVTADQVLQELATIAFGDPRALFDANGHLRNIHELSDEAAAAIAAIEVVTRNIGDGEVEYVHKVKSWDKVRALELLGKHLGMLKDRISLEGPDGNPLTLKVVTSGAEAPSSPE